MNFSWSYPSINLVHLRCVLSGKASIHPIHENVTRPIILAKILISNFPEFNFIKPLLDKLPRFLSSALKMNAGISKFRHYINCISKYRDISISLLAQLYAVPDRHPVRTERKRQ